MSVFSFKKTFYAAVIASASLASSLACAGGITLAGTRIVYPAGQHQVSMSVRNTSAQSTFLVQSWVESADGQKSQDFVVTPPLYASAPGNENSLRLMYVGKPVSTNQESLYYFNTKAIPSMDKKAMEGKNMLMLAAISRIKLFVRPAGLQPSVEKAPSGLTFHKNGTQFRIDNPTPYFITLAQLKIGGKKLPDTMVAPFGNTSLPLPSGSSNDVTYCTINDYGAATPEYHSLLK